MGYIYLRTNKINGKKYVGQATTKNFKKRQYKWNTISQPYSGDVINRAREKYGIDAFDFKILIECKDEELNKLETYYIEKLNTKVPYGYNMTDGGEGISGYSLPRTEEWRRKLSEANKGKKRSEETKKKLSEGHKGLVRSDETRKRMSNSKKGVKFSKEHKMKLLEKRARPILQIDKTTNKIIAEFSSMAEAERIIGLLSENISACCRGRQKTAGGYKWQYK